MTKRDSSRRWEEQPGDREALAWVARFRFVGAAQVARRFDVSERRARSRLARLADCGLVVSHQPHASAIKLYALSKRGFESIGHIRRRAPRWEVQCEHDLAIADLVAELERAASTLLVLSDRECRRREADGEGAYSVDCHVGGDTQRRWPDIVIEGNGTRVAIEFEIAAKTSKRLEAILAGYVISASYDGLQVRCAHAPLQRRMERLVKDLAYDDVVAVAEGTEDPRQLLPLVGVDEAPAENRGAGASTRLSPLAANTTAAPTATSHGQRGNDRAAAPNRACNPLP